MAESNTGGWVRRVGAAGGGRTYRRQRPLNFYGILVLIVVLGLLSIAFARYEYRHPASASTTPPTVGTTWYAALGINACGVQQPPLVSNLGLSGGFHAIPFGAIQVKPTNASEAGTNATLQKFLDSYSGLQVNRQELAVPGVGARPNATTTWHKGDKCAAGTKDAGKRGVVKIAWWPNIVATVPHVTTDASSVHFSPNMLITFFFGPKGVTPPKPPHKAIKTMFDASLHATPSTTIPTLPTTLPSTPTTTAKG